MKKKNLNFEGNRWKIFRSKNLKDKVLSKYWSSALSSDPHQKLGESKKDMRRIEKYNRDYRGGNISNSHSTRSSQWV